MSVPHITQIFQHVNTGHLRAVILGGGLAYSISNNYWHHTPLVLLNPLAYASYQVFVSKTEVIKWCKETYKIDIKPMIDKA